MFGQIIPRSVHRNLLIALLFNGLLAQARPAPSNSNSIYASDSVDNYSQNAADTTPGDSNADYVEPSAPSSSMLGHLSVPVQVAIIAGAIAGAILALVLVAMTYLRHKVRVEVREERRKTALRMSMMQQDLARRRKSQMMILEALDNLRDDPTERPALPPRASQMPGGPFLKVEQSGLRNHSQVSIASSTDMTDEKKAEKRQSELEKTQRKLGFM